MRLVTMTIGCLGFATACAGAQPPAEPRYQVVLPGSELLAPTRITPHRVRYERPGAFMLYDLQRADRDGRQVYRLHVWFNRENGTPDQMDFDPTTLAYVGRRLVMADYTIDVRFDANRFTGTLRPTPESDFSAVTYDKTYPHGGFEPALMNYWITALPLAEGYTASLPVFDLNGGSGMFWANIEVVGRETLEVDGRSYDTWKVRSHGIKEKTVWVSLDHPFAIKMITRGSLVAWTVRVEG